MMIGGIIAFCVLVGLPLYIFQLMLVLIALYDDIKTEVKENFKDIYALLIALIPLSIYIALIVYSCIKFIGHFKKKENV